MNWKSRLFYSQNWNIGFCEQTPDYLIEKEELSKVRWLKHPYRDRWFADPFIYRVTEKDIVVFVEECLIDNPKGIICELIIDRKTMRLKERYVLLELDTHLSYPAIVEMGGSVYVYPENGASGKLRIYEYDSENHKLINPVCILDEAVADSTIISYNGTYYLIATLSECSTDGAYLYKSKDLMGPYTKVAQYPVQKGFNSSRPAGNWIRLNKEIFRPVQNCEKRYGGGMRIMKVKNIIPYDEHFLFAIVPKSYKYHLGTHTLNYSNDGELTAIDGYGYFYPTLGRLLKVLFQIKQILTKK